MTWHFPSKFKIHMPLDATIPLLGIYSAGTFAHVGNDQCVGWPLSIPPKLENNVHVHVGLNKNCSTSVEWITLHKKMNEEQTPYASPQNDLQDSLLSEKWRGKTACRKCYYLAPKGRNKWICVFVTFNIRLTHAKNIFGKTFRQS